MVAGSAISGHPGQRKKADPSLAHLGVPAAGDPGIDTMLNTAWRVPGQPTGEVLAAIGGHHPDKRIAKAARKALFKYRSAS